MKSYRAVVGTYSLRGSKGLYGLRIQGDSLEVTGTAPAHDVGYLAAHPNGRWVYATRESMIFRGRATGGVGAYEMDEDGGLRLVNEEECAGQMPCHISLCADGSMAYVSSFLNGCVSLMPTGADGALGKPVRVLQHEMVQNIFPSVHCSLETEDGKYLATADVTQHRVALYDLNDGLKEVFGLQLPEPFTYRPRHIAFCKGHAYIVTETGHDLMDFTYLPDGARPLSLMGRRPLLPDSFQGKARGSALRVTPDKRLLIASVRYADYLTVFPLLTDGTPQQPRFIRTKGRSPRDFAISPDGKLLLAGMQNSDTVELYRIDAQRADLILIGELSHIPCSTSVAFMAQKG